MFGHSDPDNVYIIEFQKDDGTWAREFGQEFSSYGDAAKASKKLLRQTGVQNTRIIRKSKRT